MSSLKQAISRILCNADLMEQNHLGSYDRRQYLLYVSFKKIGPQMAYSLNNFRFGGHGWNEFHFTCKASDSWVCLVIWFGLSLLPCVLEESACLTYKAPLRIKRDDARVQESRADAGL